MVLLLFKEDIYIIIAHSEIKTEAVPSFTKTSIKRKNSHDLFFF